MAIQRTITWHTGTNVFSTEEEFITFISNFSDTTNPLKLIREQFISQNKITSFKREVGNNTVSFVTTYSNNEDQLSYSELVDGTGISSWLEGLGWSKTSDTVIEI